MNDVGVRRCQLFKSSIRRIGTVEPAALGVAPELGFGDEVDVVKRREASEGGAGV
jgi:hypothetical protein